MNRAIWAVPLLSAIYWGSYKTAENCQYIICREEWAGGDARAAICGFSMSMIVLLIIRQIYLWVKEI